ncbi:hypothetical protein V6N11_021139 [Hibiscus sabdariffa]|uniref:Transmembrane protein n=1 Tax=Hibiscus sabdariffa TaxID=183260 RepID=A0ABR1ZFH4_9ROSI
MIWSCWWKVIVVFWLGTPVLRSWNIFRSMRLFWPDWKLRLWNAKVKIYEIEGFLCSKDERDHFWRRKSGGDEVGIERSNKDHGIMRIGTKDNWMVL